MTVKRAALAGAGFLAAVAAAPSFAAVVTVDVNSTGRFGGPQFNSSAPGAALTEGFVFSGAGAVTITAAGLVSICFPGCGLTDIGPGGEDILDANLDGGNFFPLEEAFNDSGGSPQILPGDLSQDAGALFGVFVPVSITSLLGFQAFDADSVAFGIEAAGLFLIGAGPFNFIAPGAGTLFLGVNETFVGNNSGSFSVTIVETRATETPEPTSLALFGGALALASALTRRRQR